MVTLRVTIHRGTAVRRDDDLFGRNVAYAARVADLAVGAEILVSESTLAALDEDADVADSREVALTGLAGSHLVHRIPWTSSGS
ncbi:adenylate/guanylate cyclase domain-containing protein [Nocardioides marmoraquaticus]